MVCHNIAQNQPTQEAHTKLLRFRVIRTAKVIAE
jgi:hypothetical protein